jgi:RHS repeat-associated protein
MQFLDAGWRRVTDDAGFDPQESGIAGGHEHLLFDEPITATEKGFIYIWVSNQSEATKVWFDDLTVKFSGSFVTQSTDYGVWGDVLREQKVDESKYRFGYQGQFAEKDEETGWNHFELREYDPVIGRWLVIDPANQYCSPYVAFGNNPLSRVDPDGGADGDVGGDDWGPSPESLQLQLYLSFTAARAKASQSTGLLASFGNGILGSLSDTWEGFKHEFTWDGTLDRLKLVGAPGLYLSEKAPLLRDAGEQLLNDVPNWDANDWSYAGGYVTGMVAQAWFTKRIASGNVSVGKFQFSLMSKVSAPGMSGHRVIGFKAGKFQAALDYHNWPTRTLKDLAKGYGPINSKFWHYHFGRGNPGGRHMQIGTGKPIMDGSQLRSGIFGNY